MHVELIEHLRCPATHEESHLVAAASRSDHRRILSGVLGCPVCGAEYPIEDGVARFAPVKESRGAPVPEGGLEDAMRAAALLELTDARGFAVLFGAWCALAAHLESLTETPLVLVNPPAGVAAGGYGAVACEGTLPMAHGVARAAALDATLALTPGAQLACVRAGGRVVAGVAVEPPAGLRELARDDRHWVAEKTAADGGTPRLVSLRRAP